LRVRVNHLLGTFVAYRSLYRLPHLCRGIHFFAKGVIFVAHRIFHNGVKLTSDSS
jgi:hypothetical protein